jgi:hypothetical protein
VARWFRQGISVADPFGCRCLNVLAMLRFHIPLVEPDVRISLIRLRVASLEEVEHLADGVERAVLRTVRVLLGLQVGLEDGAEH